MFLVIKSQFIFSDHQVEELVKREFCIKHSTQGFVCESIVIFNIIIYIHVQ